MIKFYTIDCPACNVLQKKMDAKNIAYDIVKDETIFVEKGIEVFPMLEIDGGPLMDFSTARKWVDSQED